MAKTLCPKCQRAGDVADFLAKMAINCKSCGSRVTILTADGSIPAPKSVPAPAPVEVPEPPRSTLASVVLELAKAPIPLTTQERAAIPVAPPIRRARREVSHEVVLASRLSRFLAALICRAVAILIQMAILVPVVGIVVALDLSEKMSDLLMNLGNAVSSALYLALFIYLRASRSQDVGKYLLGIKIVREDGSPAGFVQSCLQREFAFNCIIFAMLVIGFIFTTGCAIVGLVIVILAVALIWIDVLAIFGQREQCLHDRLAGTIVIRVTPPQQTYTDEYD